MKRFEEGIIKLLYMTAASDGTFHPNELESIKQKLDTYPWLRTVTRNRASQIEQELMENIYNKKPESEILAEIKAIIPDELKPTAYALALEICAKDDVMHKDEMAFLKKVSKLFAIDNETANSLKKSVDVRYFIKAFKN